MDELLVALKWACFWNAVFMLLWMGYRMMQNQHLLWIVTDALLAVVSIVIAWRYHETEDKY